MSKPEPKNAEHYMGLGYTVVMRLDEEGDVVAEIQELEGCIAHGKDAGEAWDNVRYVQKAWIEERIESGELVPEPEAEEDLPSGKWVQRVPRTLHKRLTDTARKESVSLNQLVTSMLASALMAKSVAEYVSGHFKKPHAFYHVWQRNAQVDWLIGGQFQSNLLENLGTIHRLLP